MDAGNGPMLLLYSAYPLTSFDQAFPPLVSLVVHYLPNPPLRTVNPYHDVQIVDKDVEAVWATAVVAAFLKKKFADQENNWDLVVKKAAKFIARQKKSIKLKNVDEDLKWLDLAAAFLSA